MAVPAARQVSAARGRLLDAADELFAAEGITATGVDRLIAVAQVTKATFYKQFGSKDALILAYLDGRDRRSRAELASLADTGGSPRAVLRAFVDGVVAELASPAFRGDPFLNAAADYPDAGSAVRVAVADHRDAVTGFLEDRFREAGDARPGSSADELMLLRDGAMSGAYAGDAIGAASAFTRAAARLLG